LPEARAGSIFPLFPSFVRRARLELDPPLAPSFTIKVLAFLVLFFSKTIKSEDGVRRPFYFLYVAPLCLPQVPNRTPQAVDAAFFFFPLPILALEGVPSNPGHFLPFPSPFLEPWPKFSLKLRWCSLLLSPLFGTPPCEGDVAEGRFLPFWPSLIFSSSLMSTLDTRSIRPFPFCVVFFPCPQLLIFDPFGPALASRNLSPDSTPVPSLLHPPSLSHL